MSILLDAQGLVHGPREEEYQHPAATWGCIAELWRDLIKHSYGLDVPLTADFACLMMVAVKLAREAGKHNRDNLVDAAGYAECAQMCVDYKPL